MNPSHRATLLILLGALAFSIAGCHKRAAQAAPPPTPSAPTTEPSAPPAAPPTEVKPEPVPAPAPSAPAAVTPAPKPAPSKPPQPKSPPPQISQRLSPEERTAAERRTSEDIRGAEKNLQVAYGKQLNAAQHDLVEKVRGFLAQAREAINAEDWVRARNLAQKAYVLSVELINSL